MSLRYFSCLAASLACAPLALAIRPHAEATPAPAPAAAQTADASKSDAAATADVPPYILKNHSTFSAGAEVNRAPFWPIGWVKRVAGAPAQPQEAPVAPKVLLDQNSFVVTSIMIGSGATPSLAVINHRAYSEGEFLRMPRTPGAPMRIRVQRITDGAVTLQNGTQGLIIPLHRQELIAHKPDEQLLDPDR